MNSPVHRRWGKCLASVLSIFPLHEDDELCIIYQYPSNFEEEMSGRRDQADLIRMKHKYRRLILSGKIRLPVKDAAPLLGPDCAYHLYSQASVSKKTDQKSKSKKTLKKN